MNNPLKFIDPFGEVKFSSDEAEKNYSEAKQYLSKSEEGQQLVADFESLEGDQEPTLSLGEPGATEYNAATNEVTWDEHGGIETAGQGGEPAPDGGTQQSPAMALGHEMSHAVQRNKNPDQYKADKGKEGGPGFRNAEERRVVLGPETRIAKQLGEPTRQTHRGPLNSTLGPTSRKSPESVCPCP